MLSGRLPLLSLILLVSLLGGGALYAQLEGGDRGIPPVDSTSTFEVNGVEVDVTGDNADDAREKGWREAQARGWKALWAHTNKQPASAAPDLPQSALDAMVAGIIIENEQIGPRRYIATLGVLFDRARTGQLLGVSGQVRRSPPMLVIPVMLTGSTAQVFESRTEWQKAWARFRTSNSPVDYVRPVGNGVDPLLLNAGQPGRNGRSWWRMLLDQYGAADILVPEVHLKRLYPGGPVIGTFTARHGPDNLFIDRFTLRVERSALIPKLLDEGIRRLDQAYVAALQDGRLTPDPSLTYEEPAIVSEVAEQVEEAQSVEPSTNSLVTAPVPVGASSSYSIQAGTADQAEVDQIELAVSRIPGVTSALATNISYGGTSTIRITYTGNPQQLAAALRAQGWNVEGSGSSLRISRGQ